MFVVYLSPTGIKAAPADTSRQCDASKDKKNDDNNHSKDDSKKSNCSSIISVSKMNSKTMNIATEGFINFFLGKKSSCNWFKEGQQRLWNYSVV